MSICYWFPGSTFTAKTRSLKAPLLYEINTRCWLGELSAKTGERVTLGNIPQAEFEMWARVGFSHIWLMGVWTTGPKARAKALGEPDQPPQYSEALPDWRPEDVGGSPYAIAEYRIPESLGGENELASFRERLHAHGLKLILDFVPNHLGVDHSWIHERPELFVCSTKERPETLQVQTAGGSRWLAHGKDPYFAAWTDTVQLDYRKPETGRAMIDLLLQIASKCDGVRCDMAMLLLNEVFTKTWASWPTDAIGGASTEFWAQAIEEIRRLYPEFLFLAEAYWGLEPKLQELGFDFTYDKTLYDRLISDDGAGVLSHLKSRPEGAICRSAHFLENHDERRIASILPLQQHHAAAFLIMALPGMRLLHEKQFTGPKLKLPVQLLRRFPEPKDEEICTMYKRLLRAIKESNVGQGRGRLLQVNAHPVGAPCVCIEWPGCFRARDLACVNYSDQSCQLSLEGNATAGGAAWSSTGVLRQLEKFFVSDDSVHACLEGNICRVNLPAYGALLMRLHSA